tara:strand:+ start:769 stop:1776 length:1008 start_codon:yes stop_codon:yes gene_type:complete
MKDVLITKKKLKIKNISYGTAVLGNYYEVFSNDEASKVINKAFDLGINYFDTAPLYGFGLSEHRVGMNLQLKERDSYILSTKVGRLLSPAGPKEIDRGAWKGGLNFNPYYDYSYDGTMRCIEQSMHRLGISKIDILHIHDVDYFTHKEKHLVEKYFSEAIKGAYKALEELRRNGNISAISIGINEFEMAERFLKEVDVDCVMLAGRYTLLEQNSLKTFLPLCEKNKVDILLAAPFNSGILAGNENNLNWNYAKASKELIDKVHSLKKICGNYNIPLAAAAIQFPLAHPVVKTVVTGAVNVKELEDNVSYLDVKIPNDFWQELKALDLIAKESPVP